MKTLTAVSAALIALSIGSATAFAQSGAGGDWLGIGEVTAKLEASGYTVREIERDDGRYEVELTDGDGVRYEAKVNRVTGEIIHKERDD